MSVPEYIYGAIAPTFTIFNDDGSLDDAGQRRFLDFMLERGGVSAYFLRSGMGQMYTYSLEDTKQMAKNVCAHMQGKAPVLIGCSGIWDRNYDQKPDYATYLAQGIELGQYAEQQGADGLVYTIPEAIDPEAGESMDAFLVRYFTAICAAVKCPVLIYQPPGTKAEYCVTETSITALAEMDNLVGMKISSSDANYLFEMIRATRDKDFGFIVGNETAFYAGCVAGARACIGQGTTLNPKIIRAIVERWEAGDIAGMIEAQEATNTLVRVCPNPVEFFKRYATEQGYPVGLTARSVDASGYAATRPSLSEADYAAYKKVFESLNAAYE